MRVGPWLLLLLLALACDGHGTGSAGASVGPAAVPVETSVEPVVAPRPAAPSAEPQALHDAGQDERTLFLGEPEQAQLASLAASEPVEIERGRGGRSLAFKITLADGTVGYFKPEQTFSAAHWYAEVASYELDRALTIGRVPPTVARRLPWAPLRRAARGDRRIPEVVVQADGTVRGAFIWWVPERLVRLSAGRGWDRWVRQAGPLVINPFQRPIEWRRASTRWRALVAEGRQREFRGSGRAAGEPDTPDRPAELSDLILFDYLTANTDRWGGNFTNVRTVGAGGPLMYLDNGDGFALGPVAHIPVMDARLRALQRFRRSTVDRIEALDMETLSRRLGRGPLGPVLGPRQLAQLEIRRRLVLEHVARMEQRFGERAFW